MTLTPCQHAFVKYMRGQLPDVKGLCDERLLMTWNEAWADWLAACRWAWKHPGEVGNAAGVLRVEKKPAWNQPQGDWIDYEVGNTASERSQIFGESE